MKTSVNDSSLISWSINSLYKKCAKKPKKDNQAKPPPKKSTTTLEQTIQLLSKHKSLRTKTENKIINNYLSEHKLVCKFQQCHQGEYKIYHLLHRI